jgi:hypothetical protein
MPNHLRVTVGLREERAFARRVSMDRLLVIGTGLIGGSALACAPTPHQA